MGVLVGVSVRSISALCQKSAGTKIASAITMSMRPCGWLIWAWLSPSVAFMTRPCLLAQKDLEVNLTGFQSFTQRQKKGIQLKDAEFFEMLGLAKVVWAKKALLMHRCPGATAVSSAYLLTEEVSRAPMIESNLQHERHFHQISHYQRCLVDSVHQCSPRDFDSWPVDQAIEVQNTVVVWLKSRVAAMREWLTESPAAGKEISDEEHLQALADTGNALDELGLEWWPCCGTLIALMRYGKRSGHLSDGQVDVVDHDVDIMVGVKSEKAWASVKWEIWQKLVDRGWKTCFGRYSVDGDPDTLRLAREDLLLCTRQDPDITLDIASYIIEDQSVYAQKYCTPGLLEVFFVFTCFCFVWLTQKNILFKGNMFSKTVISKISSFFDPLGISTT